MALVQIAAVVIVRRLALHAGRNPKLQGGILLEHHVAAVKDEDCSHHVSVYGQFTTQGSMLEDDWTYGM